MSFALRRFTHITAIAALAVIAACDGDSTAPGADQIEFEPTAVTLTGFDGSALVRNSGDVAVGPVSLSPQPVTNAGGAQIPAAQLVIGPSTIPSLGPGDAAAIAITILISGTLEPGSYSAQLDAIVAEERVATLSVSFAVGGSGPSGVAASLTISGGPTTARQGDVVTYTVETRDASNALITDPTLVWSIVPGAAGLIAADGRLVGYEPSTPRVVASARGLADTLPITITARGGLSGSFNVIGRGDETTRHTSDLWVHGNHAYTGTWQCRSGSCGDRIFAWNIGDPSTPVRNGTVVVDARTVNDVKVRADGAIAVVTHEGFVPNGITLLDLSNPGQPSVITRFTAGLEAGVHNVWIEGNHVYAVVDGGGLRVIDISNPANPTEVAFVPINGLHDIYVRDGLAFLSDIGLGALIIMDVGAGGPPAAPTNPIELSRIQTAGGDTHNAWYWPTTGYVFVGEEDFGTPGRMHVVDASDLSSPVEVATFRVPGATPHNFWLDEARAILYMAWYENGIRALDVSGTLMGELDRQGREIASLVYGGSGSCFAGIGTCTWAPQLHNGLIFLSDLNSGLWVLQPDF